MSYSSIPSAQTLVLHFKSRGIKHIVISPGSRNAPLTLSFSKNPYFSCYSIVDERCAAFFAMGMAQQLQQPVAVICTSGSALLNFYPAVAEAFYSDIPLLVVSADRPGYRIDIGDGQTIRQENALEKHIGYSANLKQDISHASEKISKYAPSLLEESQESIQKYNEEELTKALNIASGEKFPVHINIPFEEPLYDSVEHPTIELAQQAEMPVASEHVDWIELRAQWESSERILVLVGVNAPSSIESEVLEALANEGNTLVFTETTSNMNHPKFFPSIDSIIAPIEKSTNSDELFRALQPDLLVTFGGMIVSKKIKAFLRKYQPKKHWHIDSKKAYDTFFNLSGHIKMKPNEFFKKLGLSAVPKSPYQEHWEGVKRCYEKRREVYLKEIPFSDFMVFDRVLGSIPKGYQVHLANSSTVRYAQLFSMDDSLQVYCNRGTSGIDGSTSTALGASVYTKNPTLLITGDLSFFYDSNALWNSHIRKDFRIILVNNTGGGIFRILPGKEDTTEFSRFFETNHQLNASNLANMFNFEYQKASTDEEVKGCLEQFYELSSKPRILEIFTPREVNNKVLLDYFDFIS